MMRKMPDFKIHMNSLFGLSIFQITINDNNNNKKQQQQQQFIQVFKQDFLFKLDKIQEV